MKRLVFAVSEAWMFEVYIVVVQSIAPVVVEVVVEM